MKPCDEWPKSKYPNGYGQDKSIPGEQYAHRAEWVRHHGVVPKGLKVLHRCDNPPCREITHLFLGTSADNSADMAAKRRSTWGEYHPMAKLNWAKVQVIRDMRPTHTLRELAEIFDVSKAAISNAANGKSWKIPDEAV